jgi:Flp pilus assembly protein TadD
VPSAPAVPVAPILEEVEEVLPSEEIVAVTDEVMGEEIAVAEEASEVASERHRSRRARRASMGERGGEEAVVVAASAVESGTETEAPADVGEGAADEEALPTEERIPRDATAIVRDALAAYVRGQIPRAATLYRRAVAADPSNADAWRGLGMVSARMGQNDRAANAYRRYLALAPNAADAGRIRSLLEGL